jgi:uncharacterized protein (TIGR03435 family)
MAVRSPSLPTQACLLLMALASPVCSFARQNPPEFEVVSIRPYVSQGDPANESTDTRVLPGGRFAGRNVGILKLIRNSFLVEDSRISGLPGWAGSETYNIDARTTGGVEITWDNISQLVRTILESRFQLRFHRETKEIGVYSLESSKGESAMKAHAGNEPPAMSVNSQSGVVTVRCTNVSLQDLAGVLSRQTGRPVIDNTGVAGKFDFDLQWSSEQAPEPGPSVFAALRALGLRLVAAKGPAEFIVVDHIERPSEN